MGFQEKSAWACLVGIVVVYTPYFWVVLQQPMAAVGLFMLAAIALAALLTAFHIVNALATRSIRKAGDVPPEDELDSKIERLAAKVSGIVLGFVVLAWCIFAMYEVLALGVSEFSDSQAAGGAVTASAFVVPAMVAMIGIHALFAGFVIANLTYYAGIITGYRRLARG